MSTRSPEDNSQPLETHRDREQALARARRQILALPPEKALAAILNHPYPVTLVQSMAEEDLYILVHAIGPDDALPVLGMASNVQWEYCLDMEIWDRDRLNPLAATEWLGRLLKADPDRFTHWIAGEQRDIFEYYLFRNIELRVREYEEDPAEFGDGYSTQDDVHYIRLRSYPAEHEQHQEVRDQFVGDLLRRISVYDYPLYKALLLESATVIAAEAEEELLRLRTVRLAEKGLLPFEEAVGVYQPLEMVDLLQRGRKPADAGGRPVESYPMPVPAAEPPAGADRFARTLALIQDEAVLQRLQSEFAGLCNQVIMADLKPVRDRNALARTVAKVSGYISIGLEKADAEASDDDSYRSVNLVQSHLLADIFRVGYGCALGLKRKAEQWRRDSWFSRAGLPLSFWGESGMGVLGGLLIKKPLFFDNYASGVLYREFAGMDDVHTTEAILQKVISVDDLFALMGVTVARYGGDAMATWQNILLTLWANDCLGMEGDRASARPLTLDQLRTFLDRLWQGDAHPRRIMDSMREHFLAWLAQRSGLTTYAVAERMGTVLEALFTLLESELGAVAAKDLDSRHIHLFLLEGG